MVLGHSEVLFVRYFLASVLFFLILLASLLGDWLQSGRRRRILAGAVAFGIPWTVQRKWRTGSAPASLPDGRRIAKGPSILPWLLRLFAIYGSSAGVLR